MSFDSYKVYEKQEIVKLAVKAVQEEDLELFKSHLNSIKEDLNKYPVYKEIKHSSIAKIIIGLNTVPLLEYGPRIYLSDEFGYVKGYCSFMDYFLVNAVDTLDTRDTNNIIEYLLSLEDIDYSKLANTINSLIKKSKFALLKRILVKHDKLDYRLTDYSASAHIKDRDDCVELSVLETIMLNQPGYKKGFGVKYIPIDRILSKLIRKEKDHEAFCLANKLLLQYSDCLYNYQDTLKVLISFLSNDDLSPEDYLLVESIMKFLIKGYERYESQIYRYSYKRLDELLSNIKPSKKWDEYFKDFIQLIPNDMLYRRTFRVFYESKMYDYLEQFINIYDKEWFLSEIRKNDRYNTYAMYIDYMIKHKNDFEELIYAYNNYFNESTDNYDKLSVNKLNNLISDYLIDLYKEERYESIKDFFNSNNIQVRFFEDYLKHLILQRDIHGIKFVLPNNKYIITNEDKITISRLIDFTVDKTDNKEINRYLVKISTPSIVDTLSSKIKNTLSEIKKNKDERDLSYKK